MMFIVMLFDWFLIVFMLVVVGYVFVVVFVLWLCMLCMVVCDGFELVSVFKLLCGVELYLYENFVIFCE